MAKKRKANVYYNSDTDTWSDDSREQFSLLPGTSTYKDYMEDKELAKEKAAGDEFHDELEHQNEVYRELQLDKEKDHEVHNVGKRKYRRYMSKDVQSKDAIKIAENGLDRHVSKRDLNDELFDDGISGDSYKHEVLEDYKSEFNEKRQIPNVDSDHDGDIDEDDDAYMTPGMKKMARYM